MLLLSVILLLPVLQLALAACGSSSSSASSSGSGLLDAVAITGSVGQKPQVQWKGTLTADKVQTTTLTQGTGDTINEGDQVSAQIWIGNGSSKKEAYSTYDQGGAQVLTLNSQLTAVFANAIKGASVGSRIAVTAPASQLVGPSGNSQLGIKGTDPLLVVIDLLSKPKPPLPGPTGKAQSAPSWAPRVVAKGTAVTGLDFKKTPKPDGKLRSAVLIQGTGATVKKGQSITVNYLGAVYGAAKPFDESYSTKRFLYAATGSSVDPNKAMSIQVIKGWMQCLVGLPVGSRVIIGIPPALGYGSKAQGPIPANSTLYFVVDVLGAA